MVSVITTLGKNKLLDEALDGSGYTAAWYVGLKDTGTIDVADTMVSHAAWATISPYSNATDPEYTPGAAANGSIDNSAAKAIFNITGADEVIYGAFIKDSSEVDVATGLLFGGGDFTAARSVISGDTLNVTITVTIT